MSEVILNATAREATGKKSAKQLRREGKVPAVYYAHNEKTEALTIELKELVDIVRVDTNLFDLKIGRKKAKKCILKDVQFDPVTNTPLHADLMGVRMKEKINLLVPVHTIGEAIGVKDEGGVLNQVLYEIEISCLPLDLPEYIEVDVSDLKIGSTIHVRDISMDKVDILLDDDLVVVSVIAPRAVKEDVVAETLEGEDVEEEAEEDVEE